MVLARDRIVELDRAHVWHPYTGIDAWAATEPIVVARAKGPFFYDADGRRYYDGNASWWVANLGHGHPRLLRVLREQAEVLAHCALAGIAHEPAARLAEDLVRVTPEGLNRVFYTDNGSGSIEVAVKMAIQAWKQRGAKKKTRFLALAGAFHGDTLAPTSLGGVDLFKRPFADIVFECVHAPFPEPGAYERAFEAIADLVRRERDTIAAVVVEPLVQGAAGMRMYDARYLTALSALARENDVLLVVDEVFAGYGRTGTMWACEQAGITPDIMCIGKAFAGLLPMGATLATDGVVDAFRGAEKDRTLYYGHTFCGHPLGAALAREVLAIYADERIVEGVVTKHATMAKIFAQIAELPAVARVRTLGTIGAADLRPLTARASGASPEGASGSVHGVADTTGYLGELGWRVYEEGLRRGAYLRPLGDTVYLCPPLTITEAELTELGGILEESIRAASSGHTAR